MTNSNALKDEKTPETEPHSSKKEVTKFQYTLTKMKRTWVGYVMVLPFCVTFLFFTVIPVILSILLSFTDFNMLQWPTWRFLDNYIRLFLEDDLFLKAFQKSLDIVAISVYGIWRHRPFESQITLKVIV